LAARAADDVAKLRKQFDTNLKASQKQKAQDDAKIVLELKQQLAALKQRHDAELKQMLRQQVRCEPVEYSVLLASYTHQRHTPNRIKI
jgi:hypothetical protein